MVRLTKYFFYVFVMLHCTASAQRDSTTHTKRLRITPLPVVYYSPETRLGFGALVAASFETIKASDSITKSSYAQTYFLYTINKQYDWGTSTRVYHHKINSSFMANSTIPFFPSIITV